MPFLLLLRTAAILQGSRSLPPPCLEKTSIDRKKKKKNLLTNDWPMLLLRSSSELALFFFFFFTECAASKSRAWAHQRFIYSTLSSTFFFFFYTRREKTQKFPPTPLRDDSQTHIYRDYYYVRTYREALIDFFFFFFVPPGRHRAWKFWLFFFFSCINIFFLFFPCVDFLFFSRFLFLLFVTCASRFVSPKNATRFLSISSPVFSCFRLSHFYIFQSLSSLRCTSQNKPSSLPPTQHVLWDNFRLGLSKCRRERYLTT
jgi:hypothetical protein